MKVKRLAIVSAAVLALTGGVTLAGCSSVTEVDAVATVNGTKLTRTDFEDLAKLLDEAGIFKMTNGSLTSDDSRQLLLTMINAQVVRDVLAEYKITVSDADRQAFRDQLAGSDQLAGYPTGLADYVINLYAEQGALSKVDKASASKVEDLYNSAPGASGMMCLRHLVVEDKATADKALAEYNDGADFADLAGKYSTEQNASESGGALRDTTNDKDCIAVSQYQRQFDLDFVRGALTAKAGEVVGPIKSSFGWHLIEARPFSEIKDSLVSIFADNTGAALADALWLNSDVRVNSQFGKWDASSGTIVDL